MADFVVLPVTEGTRIRLAHIAGGICAKCGCGLVENATMLSSSVHLGECAHIRGEKPGAARFDKNMTPEQRRDFDNLIYLDGRCHTIIDSQEETYNVEYLYGMKSDQWIAYKERITIALPRVQFPELKVVCDAIVSTALVPSIVGSPTHPEEKMRKNAIISSQVDFLLRSAIGTASIVQDFVGKFAQIDSRFPERLRSGFLDEYNTQYAAGLRGDALFLSLHSFAASHSPDVAHRAAALSVLGYLFEACEIFET